MTSALNHKFLKKYIKTFEILFSIEEIEKKLERRLVTKDSSQNSKCLKTT